MPLYNRTFTCPCDGITLLQIINGDPQAWKSDASRDGGHILVCRQCECVFRTEDDGIPVASGGGIRIKSESAPRVDSINVRSGSIIGGTTVTVMGHSFTNSTPSVFFGGVPGTNVSVINDESLTVKTPANTVLLRTTTPPAFRVSIGSVSNGSLQTGEIVKGKDSGATARILQLSSTFLMISPINGDLRQGEFITGATTTARTTISAGPHQIQFVVGETVEGLDSGSTAVVRKSWPLRVDTILGKFLPGEPVWGRTSGAWAQTGSGPIEGDADVKVTSAWGARRDGSTLPAAFEYLP